VLKRLVRGTDHWPPSSGDSKNKRNCTSTAHMFLKLPRVPLPCTCLQ